MSASFSRLSFLKISALLMLDASMGFAKPFSQHSQKRYIEGGLFDIPKGSPYGNWLAQSFKNFSRVGLFRYDLDTEKYEEVACITPAHSVLKHPTKADLSIAIPKNSNSISLVSWTEKKELKSLVLEEDMFFGHGVFIPNTVTFAAGGFEKKTGKGLIFIIDAETLSIKKRILTPQGISHEIYIDGDSLYFGNFNLPKGFSPSLGILNFQTEDLKYFPANTDPSEQRVIGHFTKINDNFVCWGSNRSKGMRAFEPRLIFVNHKAHEVENFAFTGKHKESWMFNVWYNSETDSVFSSFPSLGEIVQYSLKKNAVTNIIQAPLGRGLIFDTQRKVLITNASAEILQIDLSSQKIIKKVAVAADKNRFSDHITYCQYPA